MPPGKSHEDAIEIIKSIIKDEFHTVGGLPYCHHHAILAQKECGKKVKIIAIKGGV